MPDQERYVANNAGRFLTEEERFAAVERLRFSQTGVRCTKIKMGQIKESLLDIKTYLIFIMMASA